MASSNFNMSFDPVLKQQFAEVVEGYGLTVPQAFKLLANQVIRTKVLPISFDWQANQAEKLELTPKAITRLAQTTKEFENGEFESFDNAEALLKMTAEMAK